MISFKLKFQNIFTLHRCFQSFKFYSRLQLFIFHFRVVFQVADQLDNVDEESENVDDAIEKRQRPETGKFDEKSGKSWSGKVAEEEGSRPHS